MKVFKKRMKKLQARVRDMQETHASVRRKTSKIDPVKAFRMPGSLSK